MKNVLKKTFISILSFLMVISVFNQLIITVDATQEYENIALNKHVTVSSALGENIGDHVVDGKEETKWEVGNIDSKPTVIVDLEKEETFQKVVLKWASNFAFRYKIYVAKADQKYSQILFHEEGTGVMKNGK